VLKLVERIAQTDDFDLWFHSSHRPYSFRSPFSGKEFALMLVVADPTVTETERAAVSEQIIRANCRYAVCAGHDCSRWDDSIDLAFIATDPNFSPPDERFVMTTWHENESLDDVAHYFQWNTMFADFVAERFLVVQLGGCKPDEDAIRSAIAAHFR
jgi:hypothetical protein